MSRSSARVLLRLALIPLAVLLIGFSASRFRPHARPRPRTPLCFANIVTAQGIAHSAIPAVPPSVSHSYATPSASLMLSLCLEDQAMQEEAVSPSSLRAPPIIRI
ncbi:MAG: hypothetical protein WBE86_02810 [Candidatus Acidiferrales bacterium]